MTHYLLWLAAWSALSVPLGIGLGKIIAWQDRLADRAQSLHDRPQQLGEGR